MHVADRPAPSPAERRRERRWFWIGVGTASVALAFIAYWAVLVYWPAGTQPASIQAYRESADGMSLEIQYTAGRDCDKALWTRAHETETEVVVDVAFRAFGRTEVHDDMARFCEATVPLEAPLGDRAVTNTYGDPVSDQWVDYSS